jgi:hypothetical protein
MARISRPNQLFIAAMLCILGGVGALLPVLDIEKELNLTTSDGDADLLDLDVLEDVLSAAHVSTSDTAIPEPSIINNSDDENDLLSLKDSNDILTPQESSDDILLSESASSNSTESNNTAPPTPAEITVKSNLDSMTDQELESLCRERGFEVKPDKGNELTHEDYVNAAKRCLSLEDEMNAIIAENPELAAELGDEIERMRLEKERLEAERDALLAEKDKLESKLRRAGGDPSALAGRPPSMYSTTNATTDDDNQSVEEVLRESFVRLFDRVGQDMRLVGRATRFLLKPMGSGIDVMWKYASPTIEAVITKAIDLLETVLGSGGVSLVFRTVAKNWQTMERVAVTALHTLRDALSSAMVPLSRRKDIRKVGLLVESFFGPLGESLWSGWKSLEPDLVNFKVKASTWIQRVINKTSALRESR